jgi:hypothetical protein
VTVNSRASRREQRRTRVEAAFGSNADAALDVLELTELAWHDCYGDVTPPGAVVDDILTVSEGRLDRLAHAARLAVEDSRDLRMQAEAINGQRPTAAAPSDPNARVLPDSFVGDSPSQGGLGSPRAWWPE